MISLAEAEEVEDPTKAVQAVQALKAEVGEELSKEVEGEDQEVEEEVGSDFLTN